MSIFDELNRQQRQVSELIEDIQAQIQRGQSELAFVTFQLIANKLSACMRAEHAVVYPRFERDAGLVSEVAQARAQHDRIDDAITRLRISGLNRLAWRVELSQLAKLVDQHHEHEEYNLFPIAALTFDTEQLEAIGKDFAQQLAVAVTTADPAITYEVAEPEPPVARIVRVAAA